MPILGTSSGNWVLIAVLLGMGLVLIFRSWWRRHRQARTAFSEDTSLLLSYYAGRFLSGNKDIRSVFSLKEGQLADGSYYNIVYVADQLLCIVQLTFQTKLHVVAIARETGIDETGLLLGGNHIKQVELEGDFSNYFHLYVSPEQEKQVQYILDPAAMSDVIDFCRTHSWELLNDELYVAVTRDPDQQLMTLRAMEAYVKQIRPVTAVAAAAFLDSPHAYNFTPPKPKPPAHCPVCRAVLVQKTAWYECPSGHGYLLSGKELAKLREKSLALPDEGTPDTPIAHSTINCPACGNKMAPIPYANGHTIVDSCPNCRYRWLDGGEERQVATGD